MNGQIEETMHFTEERDEAEGFCDHDGPEASDRDICPDCDEPIEDCVCFWCQVCDSDMIDCVCGKEA